MPLKSINQTRHKYIFISYETWSPYGAMGNFILIIIRYYLIVSMTLVTITVSYKSVVKLGWCLWEVSLWCSGKCTGLQYYSKWVQTPVIIFTFGLRPLGKVWISLSPPPQLWSCTRMAIALNNPWRSVCH